MCFCSLPASDKLKLYGIEKIKCGSCPECLQERANTWVLRCVAEARARKELGESCCMVTLTYDEYLRDKSGNILYGRNGEPLELPPDVTKICNKRDVQLFLKRLRSKFNSNIKYLITAEHGKRTHRAHYHAILFGVKFPDLVSYKRSQRGNQIYYSKILTSLWKNGICTVDAINIQGAMARYVTKYSMKSRGCDDTFQLFSHGLGVQWLLDHFTGQPYIISGREYSVPRVVWNAYIMEKYGSEFPITDKYRAPDSPEYERYKAARELFRAVRNSDDVYAAYLVRQSKRAQMFEELRAPDSARVSQLDSVKYFGYKKAWFGRYRFEDVQLDPLASDQKVINTFERVAERRARLFSRPRAVHLPVASRHYTANDRKPFKVFEDDTSAEIIFGEIYANPLTCAVQLC